MSIKIITDSTADIPPELLEKYDIRRVPLSVIIGDKSYKDWEEMSPKEFYRIIRETDIIPQTSQVTPNTFMEVYKEEIEKGNSIISIHLTSKASGTYQSALIAKETLNEGDITVIDSKGYSLGIGLMALEAAKMAKEGKTKDEIVNKVYDMIDRMRYIFSVDSLDYLRKGGRLSYAQAFIGGMLNIKPILWVRDGELEVIDKVRGSKKVIEKFLDYMSSFRNDFQDQTIAIVHCDNVEMALQIKEAITQRFKVGDIIVGEVGCVIGAHAGPGTSAVIFQK